MWLSYLKEFSTKTRETLMFQQSAITLSLTLPAQINKWF